MGQPAISQGSAVGLGLGILLATTPLGSWGFMMGMAIGNFLFPPQLPKPDKYTNLGLNTAQKGIPIPLLYGTMKIGGNYVWKGKLETKSIRSGKGGSGGSQVVGYKYYMNSALGVCQGESYITRMWGNDKLIYQEGLSTVTIYAGATDQTTDPTIQSNVVNPVPYKGLCYVVFDGYYLGKNQPQAPTITVEAHRYPFNSNAGTSARVYNPLKTVKNDSGGYGKSIKDSRNNVIMVDDEYVKIYNQDFELDITLDITDFAIGATDVWDIDLIETKKGRNLYILVDWDVTEVAVIKLDLNQYKKDSIILGTVDVNYFIAPASGSRTMGGMCHNDNNSFIAWTDDNGDNLYKYDWNDFSSTPTVYDLSLPIGIEDIDCVNDWLFLTGETGATERIYSIDLSDMSVVNYLTGDEDELHAISVLKGGDEFITGIMPKAHDSYLMNIYGFNKDTGIISYRESINLEEFWEEKPSSLYDGYVKWNKDGTILISFSSSVDTFGIMHLITDCNPAQVFYDVMINEREIPVAKLDLTSLQDLSDYCRDNQIGVSILINAFEKTVDFMQNLMTYIHGLIFINNEGKYEFKVFRNTDVSEATITDEDIYADEYQRIEINLKDKSLCANRINITYIDRIANYRQASFQADNILAQEEDEEIITEVVDYIYFSNDRCASRQAYRLLKFSQYDTSSFSYKLMPKYLYLNLGCVLTLNFPDMELNNQTIRVLTIGEPDYEVNGAMQVVARIEESYLNTFETYKVSRSKAKLVAPDFPSNVIPVIFEQPALRANYINTACLTFIRNDYDTMAVDVYVAEEDLTYRYIGTIPSPALASDINAIVGEDDKEIEIDTGDYPDAFAGFTLEEQRNDRSFSVIGELQVADCELTNFEFVSYREISTSGDIVTLKNCARGKYYTIPKAHTTDEVLLTLEPLRYLAYEYPDNMVGKKIYIKCVSLNYRGDEQDFDESPVYEYTLKGLTKKATHTAGLELEEGGIKLGSIKTTTLADPKIIWIDTNSMGGICRAGFNEWLLTGVFIEDNIIGNNILVYDKNLVLKATHSIGDVFEYTYLVADRNTDLGGDTEFYLGVQPKNEFGSVDDVVKKYIEIV